MKGAKFTLPKKFKEIPNADGIINWYEDKLKIMVGRQNKLSDMLSIVYKKLNNERMKI